MSGWAVKACKCNNKTNFHIGNISKYYKYE